MKFVINKGYHIYNIRCTKAARVSFSCISHPAICCFGWGRARKKEDFEATFTEAKSC